MVKCGLLARLGFKPGKQEAVGVFDAFATEEHRRAHLAGNMAKAFMSRVDEMLPTPPSVDPLNILGMKIRLT